MPAGLAALLTVVIAIPATVTLGAIFLPVRAETPAWSAPRERMITGKSALCYDSWQLEPSHRAPFDPFTPDQAHKEMQRHRDCAMHECDRKASAFCTLVSAGHATPDSSRAVAR